MPAPSDKDADQPSTGTGNRRSLAVLLLVVFVDMVGFGIIIPFLPFWAENFGATEDLVALLMSIYSAFQFVFAFPLGWLSDRIGRKPVLLVSLAGSVIGFSMLAFADTLWMIFLARAVGGVMGANISVAQAYIADITPREDRAKGMGMLGAAFGFGFIVGPALGGVLAGSDPAKPDYFTTFLFAAAVSALALVLGLVFLREPARHRAPETGGLLARLKDFALIAVYPGVALPILAATIIGIAMAGLESTWALWTNRAHGWGPKENGYFFAYIGVIMVIVQAGLVGRLVKRFGAAPLIGFAVLVLAAGMFLTPFSLTMPVLFLSGACVAIGYGLCNPALNALTSTNAPAEHQGKVMGVLQSSQSLARIIGPAIAGLLFANLGRDAPYFTAAAILVVAFFLVLLLVRRQRAHTPE